MKPRPLNLMRIEPLTLRLVADPCPDAGGFITLRETDDTEHGDTSAQPVATVYDDIQARMIVARVNAYAEMLAALRAFNDAYSFISENAPAPLQHAVRKARNAIAKAMLADG